MFQSFLLWAVLLGFLAPTSIRAESGQIEVLTHFESGCAPQSWVMSNEVYFDMREKSSLVFHARLRNAPSPLKVRFILSGSSGKESNYLKRYKSVGLLVSTDGDSYVSTDYKLIEAPFPGSDNQVKLPMLEATLYGGNDIWISNTFPYDRTRIPKLILDTSGIPDLTVEYHGEKYREFPVFRFGSCDSENQQVHYFLCGEDTWETGAIWFAEFLIRKLADDDNLRRKLTENAEIRIIPMVSPYSIGNFPSGVFLTLEGENVYAASYYTHENPPEAIRVIREQINALIEQKRIGFMTTVHSWAGARAHHGFETIRMAGNHRLNDDRYSWAKAVVNGLMQIPYGEGRVAEEIWREGLARDYFLREHNAITFRLEVSIARGQIGEIRQAAHQFLWNLSEIDDWEMVYPNGSE